MAFLQYGALAGLAHTFNWDNYMSVLQREEMLDRQAKIDAQNKARLFAEDMQVGKAFNKYDESKLKEFTTGKFKQIADVVNNNPDWDTNPFVMSYVNGLKKDLLENDITRRGMSVEQNRVAMIQWAKDHPNEVGRPKFQEQMKAYEQYNEKGTVDPEKPNVPFTFTAPIPYVDLALEGEKRGNAFKDLRYKPLNNYGGYEEVPDQNSLNAVTIDWYNQHKQQFDEEYRNHGYNSPIEWAQSTIMAGIQRKYEPGNALDYARYDLQKKEYEAKYGAKTPAYGAFEVDIVNPTAKLVPSALLDAVGDQPGELKLSSEYVGKEIPYSGKWIPNGSHKTAQYRTADGKLVSSKAFYGITQMLPEEAVSHGLIEAVPDDKTNIQEANRTIRDGFKKKAYFGVNDKGSLVLNVESFVPYDPLSTSVPIRYNKAVMSAQDVPSVNPANTQAMSQRERVRSVLESKGYDPLTFQNQYRRVGLDIGVDDSSGKVVVYKSDPKTGVNKVIRYIE